MATQRDVIRKLYAKHGRDLDRIYKGVVRSVERGEFERTTKQKNKPLRFYVAFLLEQGLARREGCGWLRK